MSFANSRKRFRISTSDDPLNQTKPKFKCVRQISRGSHISTIFVSMLSDKSWPSYGKVKNRPTVCAGDVINDVMSEWHITYAARHPHLCTWQILLKWHKSYVIKSSGQTSWHTNTYRQINTPGKQIITSLSWVIMIPTICNESLLRKHSPKRKISNSLIWSVFNRYIYTMRIPLGNGCRSLNL